MKPILLVALGLLAGLLVGCPSKTHCQSGAKHGTQCYDHESGYSTGDGDDRSSQEQGAEREKDQRPPSTAPRWK